MNNNSVIKTLASAIDARKRCEQNKNVEWFNKWTEQIKDIEDNYLPSGSGIDSGCNVDLDKSTGEKVVISTAYHHMNDVGMYDGWTEHRVIVKASLMHDIDIQITGANRNDIKEYLHEVFYTAFMEV
jgi:hypothetical protein